jgi:hypothetical protein
VELLELALKANAVELHLFRFGLKLLLVSRQQLHVVEQHAATKLAKLQVVRAEQLHQRR